MLNTVLKFWEQLSQTWDALYPGLINGDANALSIINSYLDYLSNHVQLEYSFNEINRQSLTVYNGTIELYIAARLNRDNIPFMKALYNAKLPLKNLIVSCYKAYHPSDPIIANIEFVDKDINLTSINNITAINITTNNTSTNNTFIASYEDFGYQGSYGYNSDKKPLLNIVIVVKQPLATKILKKQTINFNRPDGKMSSRDIWIQDVYNPIDIFLTNIIGEYNIINHVGYIEILPEDDPSIKDGSEFTELSDIKKMLEIILKQYNYNYCNYCEHNELQVDLQRCGKCKKIHYCSRTCQKSDWKNHKILCC